MYLIIAPIYHLEIEDSMPEYRILKGENVYVGIPPDSHSYLGKIALHNIYTLPCVQMSEKVNDNINLLDLLSSRHLEINSMFAFGFWLIKDNSVFSQFCYIVKERTTPNTNTVNTFFSNSSGRYKTTMFSKEEIHKANVLMSQLDKIMDSNAIKDNPINNENRTISSGFNTVEHNLFNRIHRVLNFISFARLTSHVLSKVSWYIVALEGLFISGNDSSTSFKLRTRIALYMGNSNEEKEFIYNLISDGYSLRSSFLHGDKVKSKLSTINAQISISIELDNILRKIVTQIIDNEDVRDLFLDGNKIENFFKDKFIGKESCK